MIVLSVVVNTSLAAVRRPLAMIGVFLISGCVATPQNVEPDPFKFSRSLSWLSYNFDVAAERDSLKITSGNETHTNTIDGTVSGVDVGDLNRDGYPEILVYITSVGSGSYGSVVGYSSNRGVSMSEIFVPLATQSPKYNKGYMGHDQFSIIEDTFVQRFPVYKPGDSNVTPSGPMRQIQYKMVDGEAARKLVVSKVIEY